MCEEKSFDCPGCGGLVLGGSTWCHHCDKVIVTNASGEKFIEDVKVLPKPSLIKKMLVVVYILVAIAWGIYEYKAFNFLENGNAYARQGLNDTSQSVYWHVVDKYEFSFSTILAAKKIGIDMEYPLSLYVAWGCAGVLVLMCFLRAICGGLYFRVFVFGLMAVVFLLLQLMWNGTIDVAISDEIAKGFVSSPRALYITSYLLVFVTVIFSIGRLKGIKK